MLRSFLIYLSKAKWAQHMVTRWKFSWRAASRFIAGEQIDDAITAIRNLNSMGINATLDHLGEHTTNEEESKRAAADIILAIDAIEEAGVRANVSIKLTQIGLALGDEICAENLQTVLTYAKERGNFIRIDMEDFTCVERTLALFEKMRKECDCPNVGVVIQSYLFRSQLDLEKILQDSGRIRLCKGAYKESPEVAYPRKKDVDASYDRLAERLLDCAYSLGSPQLSGDGKVPPLPAIATHDPVRIEHAKSYAGKIQLPKEALEFQMLYGIRRDLQEKCVAEGYPVRVYVPYGTQWYPYFVRRLAERPANLWFFISNFFRK